MKKPSKKYLQDVVKLSYNMSGKMTDILSLSTNVYKNSRCMHRHNNCPTSICSKCFAVKTVNSYDSLHKNLNINTEVLASRELASVELQNISIEILYAMEKNNTHKFRFESFGDLNNEIQAFNYLQIVCYLGYLADNHQYKIECALWTKNADDLVKAFSRFNEIDKAEIRDYLNVLVSSTFIGVPIGNGFIAKTEKALGMPIGIFTVEDKETEKSNCGARDCNKCGRCYKKFQNTTYVWEVLK